MNILVASLFVLGCAASTVGADPFDAAQARATGIARGETFSVQQIIRTAAAEFGVDPHTLLRVAFCESSYRISAIGDGGLAVGVFRFHLPLWGEIAPDLGYVTDLRRDPVAASRVAALAFSRGLGGKWSCR